MGDEDTEINPGRTTVYHGADGQCHHTPETDDPNLIYKIWHAFLDVKSCPLKRIIIQFWRSSTTPTGRRLLTCSGYPYAVSPVDHRLLKYRSACVTYHYSHDLSEDRDDPTIIDRSPAAYAAMGYFTKLVLDLSNFRTPSSCPNPLLALALECDLTCCMMIPVFTDTRFVGVIEVSMRQPRDLLVIFNELNQRIKGWFLRILPPSQFFMPKKSKYPMNVDPKAAAKELLQALSVAVEAHAITLGQVWIPYKKPHPRPHIRKELAYLAKTGIRSASHPDGDDFVKLLYQNLHVLPKKMAPLLVRRALHTHQPHLCRNIHKFTRHDHEGMLALLSTVNTKSSTCFVVSLRNSYTGGQKYAFEFFWPQTRNHVALMEDLLFTLKDSLPSFTLSSGAQIGDELRVADVADNTFSESASGLTIFPGNKRSEAPTATGASGSVKRKFIDGQGELNQYPLTNINNQEDEADDVVILAVYKGHNKLVYLPTSATFADVMDKIKQEFEDELNSVGTYKVEYQLLPGKWNGLTNDASLKSCVSAFQTSQNIDYVKFRLLAVE